MIVRLSSIKKSIERILKKIADVVYIGCLKDIRNKNLIYSSGLFDKEWYKNEYGIDSKTLLHYLNIGWKLGYDPSQEFSTIQYLKNNVDVESAKMNPLLHYLLYGKVEGRTDKKYSEKNTIDIDFFRRMSLITNLDLKLNFCEKIDVVLPIYNGYEFFDDLFKSIPQTKLNYRLIIVEDKSTDPRVLPYLENFTKVNVGTILIRNSINLGFVKSVNIALHHATNHVALINSDIILPNEWLERLMYPIFHKVNVATSTPYTNCGTICSFPEIAHDNELFLGFDFNSIDTEFKKIKPRYIEMPTGVGFCMGINKFVLSKIGFLNEDLFGKGYGEENDWCQRAIMAGFVNVQVENLFVYHKHGGSFQSIEKKLLIEKHLTILNRLYPNYGNEVQMFLEKDSNFDIRQFIKIQLFLKLELPSILVFNHTWGGGSNDYLLQKIDELNNTKFFVLSYNEITSLYETSLFCNGQTSSFISYDLELNLGMFHSVNGIWINQLVGFQNLYTLIDKIVEFSKQNKTPITFLLHDFYSLCPTINLLNDKKIFCGLPNLIECQTCLNCNNFVAYKESDGNSEHKLSIITWRASWERLLIACERVIVFSNNSKELFTKIYPKISRIEVIPHIIKPFEQNKLNSLKKREKKIIVGILGAISTPKGLHIIEEMCKIIDENKLNMKIIIIGYPEYNIEAKSFKFSGKYNRNEIPELILEHEIDLFFIPSVWPETFSYTTEEIIHLGMWLFVFDIGAQAERVKKYIKGIVIQEMNARVAIDTIIGQYKKMEQVKE